MTAPAHEALAESSVPLPPREVVDWLVCTRPARWLFAAGRPDLATPLWDRPQLLRPAEIDELLPALRGAAFTARADAEATTAEVARLLGHQPGGPTSDLWSRVEAAAGQEAGRAARWRLGEAAGVAGEYLGQPEAEDTAMVLRTYGHHQPLDAPWAVVADVVTHAARVVAWAAIAQRIVDQPRTFDARIPSRARELAIDAARRAQHPVVVALDADAAAAGLRWGES